jgi:4-carboxymuconolactone decarboxylase
MTDTSRPRIPPLPRNEWTDPAREVFSFWGEPDSWNQGSKTNVMMVMAQHPDLGKVYNSWGKHILMNNSLAVRQLELIVLRVAWRVQSTYEWDNHVGYALNAGIELDEIAACKGELGMAQWEEQDRAILKSVDDLIDDGRISDESWALLGRHYDRKQQMDLVFTVGHYVMTAWALASFDVGLESVDPIGFDLKTRTGLTPERTLKPGEQGVPS